jgi:uncharacterized protein YbjT (DUF2867 family)
MARWAGDSEAVVKASGIDYTILRPFSFLQNFINYHRHTIKNYHGFYLPNGDAQTAMVDINDLGEVAAMALTSNEHFGKTYTLSGLTYTNEALAAAISDSVGHKVSYIDVPEEQAKQSMLDNQMPEWMVNAMMELNYITKQGWTAGYSDDYKTLTGKEYTSAERFFDNNKAVFQ